MRADLILSSPSGHIKIMVDNRISKSSISFPHWPPSCFEEALEQLRYVLGKHIYHRRSLASEGFRRRWFSNVFRMENENVIGIVLLPVLLKTHVRYWSRKRQCKSVKLWPKHPGLPIRIHFLVRFSAIQFSLIERVFASAIAHGIGMCAHCIVVNQSELSKSPEHWTRISLSLSLCGSSRLLIVNR